MGIGSARGENRATAAAEMAISSPLLEASIDGARGVLLSISGGSDLGLFEINEAAQLVSEAAHQDANIIFGAVIDDGLGDEVRVTVIAAGFDGGQPTKRREPVITHAEKPEPSTTTVQNGMLGTLPKAEDDENANTAPLPTIPPTRGEDDIDIPDFLKNIN
jgi:cell division protein FtsZ